MTERRHESENLEDCESLDALLAEEEPDVSAEDYDADAGEAVGLDAGIDSGGATAEEAAVHVRDEGDDSVEPTGEEQ